MLSSSPEWIYSSTTYHTATTITTLNPAFLVARPFKCRSHKPASVAAIALRMGLGSPSGLIFQDVVSGHHTLGHCDHCPVCFTPQCWELLDPRRQPPAPQDASLLLLSLCIAAAPVLHLSASIGSESLSGAPIYVDVCTFSPHSLQHLNLRLSQMAFQVSLFFIFFSPWLVYKLLRAGALLNHPEAPTKCSVHRSWSLSPLNLRDNWQWTLCKVKV